MNDLIVRSTTLSRKTRQALWGWVMVLPLVSGIFIFYLAPFFQNLFYSFTNLGGFGSWSTFSLENYQILFSDYEFYTAFGNTVFYVVICVPVTITISLLLAIALNQKIKAVGFFRTMLFLPAVTMPAAVAMVWKWLYNYDYGLLNQMLEYFNLASVGWLSDESVVRISTSIVVIWSAIALKMVILLAGLQSIPSHLYEAARIDGASAIYRFFYITLPLLVPTLFFVSIISFIEVLQLFDVIFLIYGTSMMEERTMTIVYMFYKYAFVYNEKGFAAAISVILFMITMLLTLIQLFIGKKLLSWKVEER